MGDIRELAQELWASRETIRRFVWSCVEEETIPSPKRGRWNNLILTREIKRILFQMWFRKRKEVASIVSLAEELKRTPEAIRRMVWRLLEKGVISSPEIVRGKIFLNVSQTIAIREYYKEIEEESPVTTLAREMRFSPRYVREQIYQLIEEGKIAPKKQRRGRRTELVLSEEEKNTLLRRRLN